MNYNPRPKAHLDLLRIPMKRFEINGKEIWLTTKLGLSRILGASSSYLGDLERKGYLPRSILRIPGRRYNVVTKQVGEILLGLYTQEHVAMYATWYATVGSMTRIKFRPSMKQLVDMLDKWEQIDNRIIEEYKLDTVSSVHIARQIILDKRKIKEPGFEPGQEQSSEEDKE